MAEHGAKNITNLKKKLFNPGCQIRCGVVCTVALQIWMIASSGYLYKIEERRSNVNPHFSVNILKIATRIAFWNVDEYKCMKGRLQKKSDASQIVQSKIMLNGYVTQIAFLQKQFI